MTRSRRQQRRNPQLSIEEAEPRFRELCKDPDINSMAIAQDLLEANDLALDEMMALWPIPPLLSNEIAVRRGTRMSTAAEGYVELSPSGDVGIAWAIHQRKDGDFTDDNDRYKPMLMIRIGEFLWCEFQSRTCVPIRVGWGAVSEVDVDRFDNIISPLGKVFLSDLRPVIVLQVWRIATALKAIVRDNGLPTNASEWEHIRNRLEAYIDPGQRREIHGVPHPPPAVVSHWLVPPPRAPRKNPAREPSAFVEEARELLLSRDIESAQILQDLVLEQGITMGELGRALGMPEDVKEQIRRKATLVDEAYVVEQGGFEVTKTQQWPEEKERTLPAHWASYLINGDASGMGDDEIADIDRYVKLQGLASCTSVGDETWFAQRNDAGGLGGDVATFTFLSYKNEAPEGAWWQIFPASTSRHGSKFLATVNILYRGMVFNFPAGRRRFLSEEDAIEWSSRVAWRNAAILKMNREVDSVGKLVQLFTAGAYADGLHGLDTPKELFGGQLVGPGEMKENPKRREQSFEEQAAAFTIHERLVELLESDDPNALDIARDLLLDHQVKLADVAHRMALAGDSNVNGAPGIDPGWAADFPSGTTGELVLSREKHIKSPDYIAVSWTIYHLRRPTVKRIRDQGRTAKPYESEIQVDYLGSTWTMTEKGFGYFKRDGRFVVPRDWQDATSVHFSHLTPDKVIVDPDAFDAMADLPSIGEFGGASLEVAERRTIDMAWQVAKIIKEHRGLGDVEMASMIAHRVQPTPSKHAPRAMINPAIPNPNRFRPNPPWVTTSIADAFESIASQVRADWLPKLKNVHGAGVELVGELAEYGCGAYGCVLPTLDGSVVLKVTTDETEADFASQIAADLVAPICVEYFEAMSLTARHEGRPIYLLWREAAEDVGGLARVLGAHANDIVNAQHEIAQQAYKALFEKRLDQAKVHLREWHVAMDAVSHIRELRAFAQGVLEVYRRQKVFFGDIHAGNLGRVFRGGQAGEWVITDPGHVAVLR